MTRSPDPEDHTHIRFNAGSVRATIAAIQHRAAGALGVDENARTDTVVAMLGNNNRRAPGYWIQVFISMGIATLGLVLSSTAVVIGAMLISPLMGPIVELGMGFAVGSSFLVIRASLRVFLSILIVVAGAALLTLALPFHEITAEIASRTAPTALDLLVAVFCALMAAYTTVRPTSDTTSAAAGTAVGIALVPPLCVAGFGIGTGSGAVAGGAALLFTANFSAILVFTVLAFFVLGYNQVEAIAIERDVVSPDLTRTGKLAARAHETLRNAFGSRYGLAMRLIIPAVFLASVYVPLSRALDEVTWEVRSRDAIRRILSAQVPRAVQTSITVDRHSIALHLVLVGSNATAETVERRLETSIAASTGVVPSVSVTAVPDAQTLAAATGRSLSEASREGTIDIGVLRSRIGSAIDADWPASVVGKLAGWQLTVPSRDTPVIVVQHLGDSLGAAASELLATRWSARVGTAVDIRDQPLARDTATARLGQESSWHNRVQPILEWAADADRTMVCATGPVDSTRKTTRAQRELIASLRATPVAQAGRLVLRDSSVWSMRTALAGCPR